MEEKKIIENNFDEKIDFNKKCLLCREADITFMCEPCRCEILCKKCAMKIATGGKCKSCQNFFFGLRKIII